MNLSPSGSYLGFQDGCPHDHVPYYEMALYYNNIEYPTSDLTKGQTYDVMNPS